MVFAWLFQRKSGEVLCNTLVDNLIRQMIIDHVDKINLLHKSEPYITILE